ncbi:MAG: hypothetical protein JXR94_13120 [Candidatus Hydrogenedentes bacterium]|nr:hypothetical protein [Candidatus Hydrogenedentota bacterium]
MPARCVPFCTPNEDTRSRTSCFHAALHQLVLLKMVAFGCTPLSSQGVFTLLWELAERKRRQKIRRADEARSGRFHHVSPRLEEGLEVFQDPAVGAGGVLETFRKGDPDADLDLDPDPHLRDPKSAAQKEAVRCITDYLSNGLPVILQTRVLDGKGGRDDAGEPHAVLVFGMHLLSDPEDPYHGNGPTDEDGHPRVDIAELPGRLILHDIRTGPFTELPTREVMEQAWFKAKNEADAAIHFLTIAPKGTNFGVSYVRRQARALMRGEPLSDLEAYLGSVSCDAEGLVPRDENDMSYPHRWRYVTRLLQLHQLKARYFARVKGAQLSEQKEPCNAFEAKLKRARRQHRVEEGDYWWCVEVRPPYHPRPQGRRVPSPIPTPFCVYIWCTAQKAERNGFQPFASIRYAGRGKAVLNLNGKRNYRYAFFYNRA